MPGRTLLEVGQAVVGLLVRLGDVVADADGDDVLERLFELAVVLHRRGHREVVQLVREHDRALRAERPVLRGGDQGLVVGVDVRVGDVARARAPVVRVVFPDDRAQVEGLGDVPDPVVDVAVGRAPAGGRHAEDELEGFDLVGG